MSTLKVNTIQDASGNNGTTPALLYNGTAKAWVCLGFPGGTPTINASYNVTSLTDNGVGDATINFTNALADGNYCISGISQIDQTANAQCGEFGISRAAAYTPLNTSARIRTNNGAQVAADVRLATFVFHR